MAKQSSVEQSKRREEILELLRSGWSPRQVRTFLLKAYPGESGPSVRAIQRYRDKHVDPVTLLPSSLVTKALQSLKGTIDEVRELDLLYRAQRERIARFWDKEARTDEAQTQMNEAMRIAMEMLTRRFQLAQQLGIGRAGEDKRVSMTESRSLEVPEESFNEMLRILRKYGAEDAA